MEIYKIYKWNEEFEVSGPLKLADYMYKKNILNKHAFFEVMRRKEKYIKVNEFWRSEK